MQRFERPAPPDAFDDAVAPHRSAIEAFVAAGPPPSEAFKNHVWTAHKPAFAKAQCGRCAYCDLPVTAGQYGDVEHFRPKAGLTRLGSPKPGTDMPTQIPVSDWAWWWLAYAWDNWCLSCQVCNQVWKRNLFPVVGNHSGAPTRAPDTPLLLHPFIGPRPEDHLSFDALGAITARNGSPYGEATIRVCGLHRGPLVEARRDAARRAHREVAAFLSGRSIGQALDEIATIGSPETLFSGVVRCVWNQRTRMPWGAVFRTEDGRDHVLDEARRVLEGHR